MILLKLNIFQPIIYFTIFLSISLFFFFHAHAQENDSLHQWVISVKLDEQTTTEFATRLSNEGYVFTGISLLDTLNRHFGAIHMERVFPDAGKYEAAHRKYGLHQWYQIAFDTRKGQQIEKLINAYALNDLIDIAEPLYERELQVIPPANIPLTGINDPQFKDQWHFQNTGQTGGTPGADINLPNAWQIAQGSEEVVVAIMDGGIEITHEDLKDAIWINEAEKNGIAGVDDDGNGYIDDIHGYGFGDQRGDFYPHYHGTHVAGIIGAVNGNGIGVAGIAGGSEGIKGVRLMSCAVFGKYVQGGFPESFVYAADNGAVIAQNSWGGGGKSKVLEDAIDYFIARAGLDNSNENFDKNIQIGPMAGGIVIFAAGNSSSSSPEKGYPASYPPVMAVASTDHNDLKSSFSNYGDWIEVAAPGSDVVSTYTDNTYDKLSGTSMACPHVSGVAALIISKMGKPGFLPSQVWNILVGTTDSIDEVNSSYKDLLGTGRLNAFQALSEDDETPPAAITDLAVKASMHNRVVLTWTATGSNGNQGAASRYDIRYSTQPITQDNFNQAMAATSSPRPALAGSPETWELKGLATFSSYYFAIKAIDLFENFSPISNLVQGTTLLPPVMKVIPDSLEAHLLTGEKDTLTLIIDNTGGESSLTFSLSIQGATQQGSQPYLSNLVFPENPDPHHATDTIKVPAHQRIQNEYSTRVLVIQDSYAWGLDMAAFLYEKFDIDPTVINSSQIDTTSFDNYDIVITMGDERGDYYQNISTHQAKFENFAKKGGIVQYQLATQGSDVSIAGGSMLIYGDLEANRVIKSHPITEGLSGDLNANTANLAYITNLPEHAEILTETVTLGNPTTAVYPLGLGEIIVTGMVWEWLYQNDYDAGVMLFNATRYALESSNKWVETEMDRDVVTAGQKVEIGVTFNAQRLYGGMYRKTLVVSSDDPENPLVTIPVTLHVTGAPDIAVSADTLHFDTLYVNLTRKDTLHIRNEGSDSLRLQTLRCLSDSYQVKDTTFTLAPLSSQSVVVTFAPQLPGLLTDTLLLISNDPDQDTLKVTLIGTAIPPPLMKVSPDSLVVSLGTGEQIRQSLTLSNEDGGSILTWKGKVEYQDNTSDLESQATSALISLYNEGQQLTGEVPLAYGDFYHRGVSLTYLTGIIVDPKTDFIYGQENRGYQFFRYNSHTQRWSFLENAPLSSSYSSGSDGIYFQDKIYMVYTSNVKELGVYDLVANTWSTIPNILGVDTRNITADEHYLYLIGDEAFKRYDPDQDRWSTLAAPPFNFGSYSGLSYYDDAIYGHSGQNFARYNIADDTWISLPDLPVNNSIGSAVNLREPTYCTVSGSYLLFYNFEEESWSAASNPYFSNSNGDLVFVGGEGVSGIYVTEGVSGKGFVQYETLPAWKWLRLALDSGSADAGTEQTLSMTIDATDLAPGKYHGAVKFQSNDPFHTENAVTIALHVMDISPLPERNEPPQLTDPLLPVSLEVGQTIEALVLEKVFTDPEQDTLAFSVLATDTTIIHLSVVDGILYLAGQKEGASFVHITATDQAGNYTGGNLIVTVSNSSSKINLPPQITTHFADTTLIKNHSIQIPLFAYFHDPEADSLTFSVSSMNTVVSVSLAQDTLTLVGYAVGITEVEVSATDTQGNTVTQAFRISVTPGNRNPEIRELITDQTLTLKDTLGIDLKNFFYDDDQDELHYEVHTSDEAVVSAQLSGTYLTINPLQIGDCRIRIEAHDTHGGSKETQFIVRVTVLTATSEPAENYAFTVSPNPVEQNTLITYVVTLPAQVSIQLLDNQGKEVETIFKGIQMSGLKRLYWVPENYHPGIYFIIFTANDQTLVRKLILQ